MAITLRGNKGAPLTHDELDQNFRQFYYSSSFKGSSTNPYALSFFTSRSADYEQVVNLPTAVGEQYNIQIKSGSNNISASFFTSSNNFQYNFASNHLSVSGSGEFEGDLIVSGTLIANQFETVTVSSSILFSSGSTVNGNSLDDTHRFTGSIFVNGAKLETNARIEGLNFTASNGYSGSFTGSFLSDNGVLSSSAQIADDISGSFTSTSASFSTTITSNSSSAASDIAALVVDSGSFSTRVTATENDISNLQTATGSYASTASIDSLTSKTGSYATTSSLQTLIDNTGSYATTSSYLRNTTDTLTGDLTVTGTITAQEFISELVSSSVIYESGSTKFGDDTGDSHERTGSLNVSGAANIVGILSLPDIVNVSASLAAAVAGTGIQNVVEDTTPQLGGKLHLNGEHISGSLVHTGSSHFSGSFTASGDMFVDGLISASGDVIAFATSDERLKDNVTPIASALDKVNQIGGYEFDWNSDSEHSGHDVGVIAQEIEAVLPEVVAQRKNGFLAVRYEKIVALLIQAIKEQQLQIDELKSKL